MVGGINTYGYVGNNPLIRTDIFGLIFETSGWENAVYPSSYNTDPLGDCRMKCAVDFVNPIPGKAFDFLIKLQFGMTAEALFSRYMKVKSVYDLTSCLNQCNDKYKKYKLTLIRPKNNNFDLKTIE